MKKYTAAQKQQLMSKLLKSQEGRRRIAASVQSPLRSLRDYTNVARKAFLIDDLPDGALPVYDKDPDIPAYMVAEDGDSIETQVKSTRVSVPMFELASYPTIPFTQVKERRFDIVSRIKKKARDELFREEDKTLFALMTSAGDSNTTNTSHAVSVASFGIDTMADQYAVVESHGLRVDKVFMNPKQVPVFRKAGRDYLDFETQRELLRTGFLGTLYGAQIFTSVEVPVGRVFLVTEPEYFGVLPVRIDLTVIPADDPARRRFGWSIFENIGATIHNEKGLQQIVIS